MAKHKLERFAEMKTLPNVFQPAYYDLYKGDYPLKGKWCESYFHNNNPLTLEIGCGKGEYTVGLSLLYSDQNFIGIDIKGARMWKGAKTAYEKEIHNVAFVRMYAQMLSSVFDKSEVNQIWITFPDPQMAHANRRLTGSRFLNLYRQFLTSDGVVHLKTDSEFLFRYTMELIKANNLKCFDSQTNLHADGSEEGILGIRTFYEQQWMSRGKSIKYIAFSLNTSSDIIEPDVDIPQDDYHSEARYMTGGESLFDKM